MLLNSAGAPLRNDQHIIGQVELGCQKTPRQCILPKHDGSCWIMNNRCLSFAGLFLRQHSEAVLGQQWVHEASGWLAI